MGKIQKIKQNIRLFFKAFYKVPFLIPSWTREEVLKANCADWDIRESEQLRRAIRKLYHVKHAFDFNLGRSAIQVALRCFGLPKDSEVILSTYSCRGVIEPIIREGYTPRLVDIDGNFNISPESIEKNITPKTKVIIMSHLYGYPAQIERILGIAKKYNLYVIDDAAQVVGLQYKKKMVGTFGDIGILSFGIGKSISATGGGMLLTNNPEIAAIANLNYMFAKPDKENRVNKYLRKYYYRKWTAPFYLLGDKLRSNHREDWEIKQMSYLDCALIVSQLSKLKEIISLRQSNAKCYNELGDCNELALPKYQGNIFTKYVILIKSSKTAQELSRYLRGNGIETETNYKPLHLYPEYEKYQKIILIRASVMDDRVLTIPNHHIMTLQDIMFVIYSIKYWFTQGYHG